MQRNRNCADISDERFVNRESGTRINYLVSRFAVDLLRKSNRRLPSRKNNYMFRTCLQSSSLVDLAADCLTQGKQTFWITVFCIIQVQLSLDFILDMAGDCKIRLTKIQLDDFSILLFYTYNMRTYFEGIF